MLVNKKYNRHHHNALVLKDMGMKIPSVSIFFHYPDRILVKTEFCFEFFFFIIIFF